MFDPTSTARCFALPPGCDFSAGFLAGFQARLKGHPPEAAARVEVFVNTRRTARRLDALFASGPPGLLPRIRVITDLARDPLIGADIPAAIAPLRRRLELSQTIRALLRLQPDLAPKSAVFDLADSLANLMDEMQGEAVTPDDLARLDVAHHAAHWAHSLTFLNILGSYFGNSSEPDAEARQRLVVEHLARQWRENPPQHPVIVAGSTGSRGATALFMKTVASLPQGAVVLPGFDFETPDHVAETLRDPMIASDHPQAGLLALVNALDLRRDQVLPWHDIAPPSLARNRLVSLALRPAPVTDQWLVEGPALTGIDDATQNVTLVEATSPRQEALVIALRLRKAVEDGQTATLITPDRQLTRQVTAALDRWSIIPDDSAGRPLPLTPPGVYLRLIADIMGQQLTTETLLILLKHPLTHSAGKGRNAHLLQTRNLELDVLRGGAPFADFDAIDAWAAAHPDQPELAIWAAWIRGCLEGVDAIASQSLTDMLQTHRTLAEALAKGPMQTGESELWKKPAGVEAARLFAELVLNADAGGDLSPPEYTALFRAILNRAEVREPIAAHPQVMIWGTLEARVQGADLVILGGLNDGVWPGLPAPDPWLNRSMRAEAGLLLPERRIGLSAHDFQQAIGAPEVMLTRAIRDADAPTGASRWLIRLTNLLSGLGAHGQVALAVMQARGADWLRLAALLETPDRQVDAAKRPSPRPPVEARPDRLSVTQIKTLIRDPYAIYARKILKLNRLEPIRRDPDALLRGQALHSVLEDFVRETLDDLPVDAADKLLEIAETIFQQDAPWPATRRLWLARLGRIAADFVKAERARRDRATPIAFECKGRVQLDQPPFLLTAMADRIDRAPDGSLIIYDYKTGMIPTTGQITHFDKQMPLEAAIVARGGFDDIDPAPVAGLEYLGIGKDAVIRQVDMTDDLVDQTWAGLIALISAYRLPETGYTARARMEKRVDVSDYDHLSRLGEWADSDPAEPKDVP
jgi:double-strand break repair protein AddB